MQYPAEEFEDATGFTGISCRYKMPDNVPEEVIFHGVGAQIVKHDAGAFLKEGTPDDGVVEKFRRRVKGDKGRDDALAIVKPVADELKKLNPELQGVVYPDESIPHNHRFISGVTSRLNPDDIQHSLDNLSQKEWPDRDDLDHVEIYLHDKLGNKADHLNLQQFSPKTIDLIAEQIEEQRATLDPQPG